MIRKYEGEAAKILLVEDNPGDARLTVEAFRDGKIDNNLNHVRDGVEAMLDQLREFCDAKGMSCFRHTL